MRQRQTNSLSFKKIPTLSVFYTSGMYRKSVSQFLSFDFLRGHACDVPFYVLPFHFRLKFFHSRDYLHKILRSGNPAGRKVGVKWERDGSMVTRYGLCGRHVLFCQNWVGLWEATHHYIECTVREKAGWHCTAKEGFGIQASLQRPLCHT